MNRLLKLALGSIALSAAILANAQTIYNPTRTAKDQGLVLKSWGSGTIAETDEMAFEGTTSIRVSSRNYFQGGIVNFGTPVDLKAAFDDKNSMLQFTMQIPGQAAATTSGRKGGPGDTGGGGPGAAGSAQTGSAEGGGAGGQRGSRGGGTTSQATSMLTSSSTLDTVRLVITTTDGMRSEAFLDVRNKIADSRGWVKAGIPLQAIAGFDKTNKTVQSIAFAGDAIATFYVGEATILNDSTPLYGELNEGDLNLALGDEKTLIASGYGGASPLKFEWDFDEADGIQVDATGQVIKRKFRKPGKFVITLTVSDVYGLKKPYSTKLNVEVNP